MAGTFDLIGMRSGIVHHAAEGGDTEKPAPG
jgi:hypothetical protein